MSLNQDNQGQEQQRGLQNRHVQLIAIGGTIGTGLFMGAGNSIHFAGPAILLIYAIIGLLMFVVMRAIGEMLYADPNQHTFITFLSRYLGNRTGFFARWSYWLTVAFMGMAELTAIGKYVQFWFPQWPSWIIQIVILLVLTAVNLIAVALYGETEFWFAMIKIVAILALIVTGIMMALTGFKTAAGPVAFSNVWQHFSLFPNGVGNFVNAFQMVMFAFVGMEFIGMTAAETENPRKVLPKAINQIPWRVLFFYLGALFIIMTIYPWTKIPANQSPFVMVFELAGIDWAAALVNFVVLTSAASALNSVLFTASRNFYSLAVESRGSFLKPFAKMSKNNLPTNAIFFTSLVVAFSAIISLIPQITDAFSFVTSASTDLFLMIYILTLAAYWQYRKSSDYLKDGFLMDFPQVAVPFSLVVFVLIYITLFFNPDSVVPAIGATLWLAIFGLISRLQPQSVTK
ncbi:amino acid permease [Convivina intestini]|uniref:Amino acid/polyamine/organocation transporter (APC superfamily) n=1 Tax=Convivina intestini TaxID=1505726 RepID=A0A2U1D9C5_9LACO|nr:amino acid permease [Convivina intestini]PVY84132.1 amino acid/polyamine/organocation transporter (APC superfamily) [Convivina intestini]CAH1854472.1 Serine permease SerP1 [Convivina intestini]SDB91469.1 amino acid/polyamine/organocation transporter, APC superfamily (TC 2.A.3) [Leuconostocaceae bacterium R-53105]